jgi:hypothetical protein
MRPWKIAAGLAAAAALTAPFAFGTWQPRANAERWIALDAQERESLLAEMERSKNCRFYETQVEARDVLGLTVDQNDVSQALLCHRQQDALRDGGRTEAYFSPSRYVERNGLAALAGFAGAFTLAMVIPGVFRRYRTG